MDRGLGELADQLVAAVPKSERPKPEPQTANSESNPEKEALPEGEAGPDITPSPEAPAPVAAAVNAEAPAAEAVEVATAETPPTEAGTPAEASEPAAAASDEETAPAAKVAEVPSDRHQEKFELTAQLARLCTPFVAPDKGIHTEAEALSGAMRILADRLGRNAHLRGMIRRLLRKHGVLNARATVDESKAGRFKPLLKTRKPLRQLQGRNLLAIRQAQKERVLNTVLTLDSGKAVPKVRGVLGKHTSPAHEDVLQDVARQAFEQRLMPMIESEVRLELKERADHEALRFLAQHLRQILLAPPLGRLPVAGMDVSAKGDWNFRGVGRDGLAERRRGHVPNGK